MREKGANVTDYPLVAPQDGYSSAPELAPEASPDSSRDAKCAEDITEGVSWSLNILTKHPPQAVTAKPTPSEKKLEDQLNSSECERKITCLLSGKISYHRTMSEWINTYHELNISHLTQVVPVPIPFETRTSLRSSFQSKDTFLLSFMSATVGSTSVKKVP